MGVKAFWREWRGPVKLLLLLVVFAWLTWEGNREKSAEAQAPSKARMGWVEFQGRVKVYTRPDGVWVMELRQGTGKIQVDR